MLEAAVSIALLMSVYFAYRVLLRRADAELLWASRRDPTSENVAQHRKPLLLVMSITTAVVIYAVRHLMN